ncbi:hypothetical protein LIER_34552 [Lithospermum erythrorhizon]|uniref:Bifunctional inhibitor/plant lipid transfer protein/seed storage helical domain-containing protein n=1 Tax=Lithospermum erythrorhizon TaxID=34254 RepID=A0AAV3S367_LITER
MASKKMVMFSSACILMIMVFFSTSYTAKAARVAGLGREIECLAAAGSVLPCESFMLGKSDQPTQECCDGLQELDKEAKKSIDDKRKICQCLENGFNNLTLHPQKLKKLTQICGVSSLPSDPKFDCSR